MKTDSSFLSAVLDDGDAVTLREATRRQVVALARRRRQARAWRRAGVVGTVLLVATGALFFSRDEVRPPLAESKLTVVRSQPLRAEESVTTRGDLFAPVVSASDGWAVVRTRPLDIRITETRLATPALDYLDDRELLAAFPGQRAALIDAGTERARMIFY